MPRQMTVTQQWGPPCPVCKQRLMATYAVQLAEDGLDVTPADESGVTNVKVRGDLVGVRIDHNCIPLVTR